MRCYVATGNGCDLRRTLADSMFPFEHIAAESVELAA